MPSLLYGLFTGKCPNCREGKVFEQKGIFPLSGLLNIRAHCPVCGQKLVHERNNGGGINYAFNLMLFFLNLLWYWPIFGMSYLDHSIYYYLATSISVIIIVQPWLMRFSRMIYLYLFIQYRKGAIE